VLSQQVPPNRCPLNRVTLFLNRPSINKQFKKEKRNYGAKTSVSKGR
jgi:hypothetical protein